MPDIKTIDDAAREIKRLQRIVESLINKDLDMHGRRVVNASDSVSANDYVTRQELDRRLENL